jgi:hypothetical protein
MKFVLAMLATVLMGFVLAKGVVLATNGSVGVLLFGAAAFVLMIGYYGCRAH